MVSQVKPGDAYQDHPAPQYEVDVEIDAEMLEKAVRMAQEAVSDLSHTS